MMEERIFQALNDCKVLLIIDNLESILRSDCEATREFLQQLLEKLPHLKILSTSRDLIKDIGQITETVHELKTLEKEATIQLLMLKATPRVFSN